MFRNWSLERQSNGRFNCRILASGARQVLGEEGKATLLFQKNLDRDSSLSRGLRRSSVVSSGRPVAAHGHRVDHPSQLHCGPSTWSVRRGNRLYQYHSAREMLHTAFNELSDLKTWTIFHRSYSKSRPDNAPNLGCVQGCAIRLGPDQTHLIQPLAMMPNH